MSVLAVAEQDEPVTGARAVHRDRDVGGHVLVEELGDQARDRLHRRGAEIVMVSAQVLGASSRWRPRVLPVPPPLSSLLHAAATSANTATIARTSRPFLRFPIPTSLSGGHTIGGTLSGDG